MEYINIQTLLRFKDGKNSLLRVYPDLLLEHKVGDQMRLQPVGLGIPAEVRPGMYLVESRYDFLVVGGSGIPEKTKDLLEIKYLLHFLDEVK